MPALAPALLLCVGTAGCGAGGGSERELPAGPPTDAPPGNVVLYVAMAQGDVIAAYRLGTDGLLPTEPTSELAVENPRSLAFANGTLYAGLEDRVVAIEIGADGSLVRVRSSTQPIVEAEVLDLAINDGFLYAALEDILRIHAYALDDVTGDLDPDAISSSGTSLTDYETLAVNDGILYAAAPSAARVDTYIIAADGSLPGSPEPQFPEAAVASPENLVISGGIVYVTEQFNERILAFPIKTNGLLPEDPTSETRAEERYIDLTIDGDRLYASAFNAGRIDLYLLDPIDGSLPEGAPAASTQPDTGSFPTALKVLDGILYVAQSGRDRIDAYTLSADGSPRAFPRSSTGVFTGGFPTDLLLAELP